MQLGCEGELCEFSYLYENWMDLGIEKWSGPICYLLS